MEHLGTCRCGQLQARCAGAPIRVSVCHCLNCQKRSGSAFAAQARWLDADVTLKGAFSEWSHLGESGNRAVFRFCAVCGSTVTFASDGMPGMTAVAIGAFANPLFPAPQFSNYEDRKHAWVAVLGDAVERH
jgi:hypothetical protein